MIRDEAGIPFTSGLAELVESFRDYKGEMYKDGRWQKLKYTDYPMIEFEHNFGRLPTYPVEMPELRRLPALFPDLKNTGFFVAGFNWFADYLVTPLIMLGSRIRIAPRQINFALGRLLSWSTKTFSKPPYGTIVQVEAKGQREGQPVRFQLSLYHEDAYVLTAVPTSAMIMQMLQEPLQPGIHYMGLCCDPSKLLADIEGMGIPITTTKGVDNMTEEHPNIALLTRIHLRNMSRGTRAGYLTHPSVSSRLSRVDRMAICHYASTSIDCKSHFPSRSDSAGNALARYTSS